MSSGYATVFCKALAANHANMGNPTRTCRRAEPFFFAWLGAPLALRLATLWVGSYLYFRARHSVDGEYASSPRVWKQINYDEHFPWGIPLFHLHQPLAWLDGCTTGTEVRLWKNDFHGDRAN